MTFTVRAVDGAILAEANPHSDARRAARRVSVAHEIFSPEGVRLGFRAGVAATRLERMQFIAAESGMEDFDGQ